MEAKEILIKHLQKRNCIGSIYSDDEVYFACLDAINEALSQHDVIKRYDINFDGNVLAGIEVENSEISIYGAVNGWGNTIDINKCIIAERTK